MIFFFCKFIIYFFQFRRCSTKGAALGKEPHSPSSMFYKTGVLKNFAEFTRKHLIHLNNFTKINCFLPSGEIMETMFFYIFEHVLSRFSNVMNIMILASVAFERLNDICSSRYALLKISQVSQETICVRVAF